MLSASRYRPAYSPGCGPGRRLPLLKRRPGDASTDDRLVKALGVGLFASYLAFLLTSQGLLEAWTVGTGQPGQVTVRFGNYAHSRHQCDGFDLRDVSPHTRRVICIPASEAAEWPLGTPVVLTGMISPFGIAVDRYWISGVAP